MITDKELREVAQKLRGLPIDMYSTIVEWEKDGIFINDSVSDEGDFSHIPMPCYYFDAIVIVDGKPSKASCVNCRSECMNFDNGDSIMIDCYTLMIIDFLKSCGVEVEDEH